MLMLRLVDERVALQPAADSSPGASHDHRPSDGEPSPDDSSAMGWLHTAASDLKSVSSQVAEQAEHASERVLQGIKSFKDIALQKYREKFGKKDPP